MRKLALTDEILMRVEKPARYVGGELNAVIKDKDRIDIRFAMCFPDVYEIGMSYLGIQILYDLFNRREDTWCERVYSPWPDLDAILREKKIPLFALESQDPLKDFDFLGFTLQYEMGYRTSCRSWTSRGSPSLRRAARRTTRSSSAAGPAPTIPNPSRISSTFSIWERGKSATMRCWMRTRRTRLPAEAEWIF